MRDKEVERAMQQHPGASTGLNGSEWIRKTSKPKNEDRPLPAPSFVTKDSGKRQEFETGSRRDTQDGKPRYDLIPVESLKRLAELYARGGEKYGDNNWQKGQPYSRVYASLLRHLYQWKMGERDEDHMAAVAWNAFALMFFEEKIPELDDLFNKELETQ